MKFGEPHIQSIHEISEKAETVLQHNEIAHYNNCTLIARSGLLAVPSLRLRGIRMCILGSSAFPP